MAIRLRQGRAYTLYATLTLRSDGSHFYGTVVRRETNSITIMGSGGDTHTFLYGELLDIKYGAPGSGTGRNGDRNPHPLPGLPVRPARL